MEAITVGCFINFDREQPIRWAAFVGFRFTNPGSCWHGFVPKNKKRRNLGYKKTERYLVCSHGHLAETSSKALMDDRQQQQQRNNRTSSHLIGVTWSMLLFQLYIHPAKSD